MKVLIVEPMKPCYVREISGLNDMQEIVGGHIEAIYPFKEQVAIIANEEGKILGLPFNRHLSDERGVPYDIVCGTFFLAGLGAEDFVSLTEEQVRTMYQTALTGGVPEDKRLQYEAIRNMLEEVPKFGNDLPEVDAFARDVAYTYTRPLQEFRNPRGGQYQAGLYPVSANVPLGAQTGATPDGRYAGTPVADGVSPSAGRDTHGPTASANSVSRLDHYIASNGTLFNMKFHPSALAGREGLANFVALIRSYFDQKGSHMQFNVVSRETLLDAQKHPDKYRSLVVRVAGYSALFTTLSRSLQDDIINRTEQTSI